MNEPDEMREMERWATNYHVPGRLGLRWLSAWRRDREAQKARIEALTTALQAGLCNCGPRHDVDLNNVAAHLDFCAFREAMQSALAEAKVILDGA